MAYSGRHAEAVVKTGKLLGVALGCVLPSERAGSIVTPASADDLVQRFAEFLTVAGADLLPPTNDYELARFKTANGVCVISVSYTHLTLPTILRV